MSLLPTPGYWLDAGSGFLLILLGLWVARRKPRRRANLAFAVFSIAFGFDFLAFNLVTPDDPLFGTLVLLVLPADAVAAAALALVAWWFPRPLGARERPLAAAAAAGAAAWGLAYAVLLIAAPARYEATWGIAVDTEPLAALAMLSFTALRAAVWFALLLLALRFGAAPGAQQAWDRRQHAFLSAALLMYPGLLGGMESGGADPRWGLLSLGMLGLLAALWLLNTRHGPGTRAARSLVLLALGLPLVGLLVAPAMGGFAAAIDAGPLGASRTLAVLLLAYGILRHQLLGIEVRVKWTIKQSTMAAAFVGVFFIVSESASTFFANDAQLGPYLGIAAAGVLVFAIAPLQRAAERVADAAMPGVKPLRELGAEDRARIYLENARQAWADGSINRDERAMLDRLRDSLGLKVEEAVRLEAEAAR